jgi:coenzyme F420-0:L-glutamate ligase/coenzyme F420-1:gamma-L-glutamate ligase
MESPRTISLIPVGGLPEVCAGDDLGALLADALRPLDTRPGDILVLAHKIVSKAEGATVDLRDVTPSPEALKLAERLQKDARKVDIILRESSEVLRVKAPREGRVGVMICRHRLGMVCANAAVDESNVPGAHTVLLLPRDPDASARRIREALRERLGVALGIVIADTFGRAWRVGLVNVAIGLAGVPAVLDARGRADRGGRTLQATIPAVADELAAAAGLCMEKTAGLPAVLVRDFLWETAEDCARLLLRSKEEDLFL